MPLFEIVLFCFSFALIGISSYLLVGLVEMLTRKLHVSQFKFSMILLGVLTSVPELSIGINAALENKPDIYIGNLLGGIVVMFLWIIPFLAIFGKGIKLDHTLSKKDLLWSLGILMLPSLFILDHKLTTIESLLLIFAYILKLIFVRNQKDIDITHKTDYKSLAYGTAISALLISVIFMLSKVLVESSLVIGAAFHIPTILIGMFILTIGTNIPEFTIAISSIKSGRKEIAFGDYIGSALANVFILGLCGLISVNVEIDFGSYLVTSIFIVIACVLFYILIKSKNFLSPKEGVILVTLFVIFCIVQLLLK